MADILFPASNSTVVPAGAAKLTIFSRGTTTTTTLLQRTFNERTIKYYYFKSRDLSSYSYFQKYYSTKPFAIRKETLALLHDTSSLQLVTRNCIRFFFTSQKRCVLAATMAATASVCETHMLYYQGLFFSKSNVLLAYFVIFLDIIEALRKVGIRWIITRGVQDICHPCN